MWTDLGTVNVTLVIIQLVAKIAVSNARPAKLALTKMEVEIFTVSR